MESVNALENIVGKSLFSLQGISNANIAKYHDQLVVKVTIQDKEIAIYISETGRVQNIGFLSNNANGIDTNEILRNARSYPSPDDLRYVLFTVKAALQRDNILNEHLKQIGDNCIIKRAASANKIQLQTENGIKCAITIDSCYPQVPGGVYIDSISTNFGNDASLRDDLNLNLFRSIPDVYEAICGLQKRSALMQ